MAKILDLTIGLSCIMQGQPDAKFNQAAAGLQKFQDKLQSLQAQAQKIKSLDVARDKLEKLEVAQQGKKNRYAEINKEITALVKRQQEVRKLIKTASETGDTKALKGYKNELEQITGKVKKFKSEKSKLVTDSEKLAGRISQESSNIQKLKSSLDAAGISTGNLSGGQRQLAAQMEKVKAAQDRFVQAQSRLQQARNNLSWANIRGDLISTVAKFETLRRPIKVSMDFSSALSELDAVARLTKEQRTELENLGLKLGAETQFSNTEAVQTMTVLARAGWSVDDIKKGIGQVLNMAASEGLGLAQSADALVKILGGMGLKSDMAGELADVLAFTSSQFPTDIMKIVEVMKPAAPMAAQIGMDMKQLAALVGVMAKNGYQDSDAGTALASTIMRLAKEPKEVAAALKNLKVDIMTKDGHFREIPDLLKEIYAKTIKLGEKEQTNYLARIFGVNHGKALIALAKGAYNGEVDKADSMYNSGQYRGWAAESARIFNDNLRGDLTKLSSAIEGFLTRFGKPLEEALRPIIDILTQILSWINNFADAHPAAFKGAAIATGGVLAYQTGKTAWNIGSKVVEFVKAKGAVDAAEQGVKALTSAAGQAGAELAGSGTAAGQAVTTAGAAAGGSLMAGAAALGVMAAGIYANYKAWRADPNLRGEFFQNQIRDKQGLNAGNNTRPERMRGGRNKGGFIPHALGGIFTTPHLGLVAEAGAEAIIPLTDKTRGTGLLIQAAEKLGLIHENNNLITNNNFTRSLGETNNIINREVFNQERSLTNGSESLNMFNDNRTNSDINKQFAPVINITVNASESESRDNFSLSELIGERVRSILDEINNNFARLEYA